jgi:hypothetical protein
MEIKQFKAYVLGAVTFYLFNYMVNLYSKFRKSCKHDNIT